MTTFDEREKAFEKKFAMDQDLKFRAESRRNKMIAEWAAAKLGLSQEKLAAWPRLAELPFDSTRKRMTTIQRIDGDSAACVKGAPGEIFARCVAIRFRGFAAPFDGEWRRRAEAAHDEMARRGLRVLAVATRAFDGSNATARTWPT